MAAGPGTADQFESPAFILRELPSPASAGRASAQQLAVQGEALKEHTLLQQLLDSSIEAMLVLNEKRQILAANRNLVRLLPSGELERFLGLRPGEALGCVFSDVAPGGCGTSEHCRDCGALMAILGALNGVATRRECRVTTRDDAGGTQSLELEVLATPLNIGKDRYLTLALTDISHRKRRAVLERIFFHDVLNLAGGVYGLLENLCDEVSGPLAHDIGLSRRMTKELIEEVRAQRDLMAAELEELQVLTEGMDALGLLDDVVDLYRNHAVAKGRSLVVECSGTDDRIRSDHVLLTRLIGNLIKNALEATPTGGTVRLKLNCETADRVRFSVWNSQVMPPDVVRQIFQRSFTTKGSGRGLGTYSVKLIGERSLGGSVGFVSNPGFGTEFWLELPRGMV